MKEFTTIQQLAEALMLSSITIVFAVGLVGVVLSKQLDELKQFIKNRGNG